MDSTDLKTIEKLIKTISDFLTDNNPDEPCRDADNRGFECSSGRRYF